MKAHEFIRETFDLDSRTSISELPDLPISLIVEMLNNYKEGKVKKLLIPRVSNLLCGFFEPIDSSSATICKHCGREKWMHPKV